MQADRRRPRPESSSSAGIHHGHARPVPTVQMGPVGAGQAHCAGRLDMHAESVPAQPPATSRHAGCQCPQARREELRKSEPVGQSRLAEVLGDEVVPRHGGDVAVHHHRGRRLENALGHLRELLGRDRVDLLAEVRGADALAVRGHLSAEILEEDARALEVHVQGGLELVLGARDLVRLEGLAAHGRHLLDEHRRERAHVARGRRAVHEEEARVGVHRVGRGRVEGVGVLVEHVHVQPGEHALARAARGEGGAAAHEHVEHAHGHKVGVLPADALEGEPELSDLRVDNLAVLAACVVCLRSWGRRAARRHRAKGRLRRLHELRVVHAGGGEHHVGRGVIGLHESSEHIRRELAEALGGAHERVPQATACVARSVRLLSHVLQGVVLQLGNIVGVEGLLLRELPFHEVALEGGLSEHLNELLGVGLERGRRVDHLLTPSGCHCLRAKGLDVAHHLEVRRARGAREGHELQHVGGARVGGRLEAGPGVHHHAHIGDRGSMCLADHLEPVCHGRDVRLRSGHQPLWRLLGRLIIEGHVEWHPRDLRELRRAPSHSPEGRGGGHGCP
mmetsp:Transcript_19818/g.58488  ORF Transcript_19818/g.58488 Transcript_19818/m.58488 type:complete len:563 (-) Transcript_19818:54-1742(-)